MVSSGEGESVIDGEVISWAHNDVFTIPRNAVVSHRSISDNSVIFAVSDAAVYRKLGMLREEVLGDD